jgi:hypothetical protein
MSEVKVNKISPRSGTTVTLGDSGDTFTIPSGATINNQGTATNFGATGSASWTTTVKTSGFTAVAGEGYFVDTTSGAISVNLPAGTAGAVVAFKDYAGTFSVTNKLTLVQNGSDKIGGSTNNAILSAEGIAVTLIFIDSTEGWLVTDSGLQSEAQQPYQADFLVIAGGGSGGMSSNVGSGGGGAGGYRNSFNSETSGGGGSSESSLTFDPGIVYTITVGAGGTSVSSEASGNSGVNSSISGTGITTITSIGGGGGANNTATAISGGSGGGGGDNVSVPGGAGTANQGFDGGNVVNSSTYHVGGGGGGAGAVGATGTSSGSTGVGGAGGAGVASSITGAAVTRAGGGGGSADTRIGNTQATGGSGGGGNASSGTATSGTANTGSGGGAGGSGGSGAGGSGVVILRMPTANYSSNTTGSPTVTTSGSATILIFNSSGSYTA